MSGRLDLQPLNGVSDDLLLMLCHHLAEHTGLHVEAARSRPVPAPLDPVRRQYDAVEIIARLAAWRTGPERYLLGITTDDIYMSGLNFLFGLADPRRGVGVVSMARLASTDDALVRQRLLKEALHETGHLLGLLHCQNACVMRYSVSLQDVDAKPAAFCGRCRQHLQDRTGTPAP